MFPYGPDYGDTMLPQGDDTYTDELPISKTFHFFDVPYDSLYVSFLILRFQSFQFDWAYPA